jgi:hypothetical protein
LIKAEVEVSLRLVEKVKKKEKVEEEEENDHFLLLFFCLETICWDSNSPVYGKVVELATLPTKTLYVRVRVRERDRFLVPVKFAVKTSKNRSLCRPIFCIPLSLKGKSNPDKFSLPLSFLSLSSVYLCFLGFLCFQG